MVLMLVTVGCTAKRQPGDLTVAELFNRGAELNDKKVAVIGFYVYEYENSSLFDSPDEQQHQFEYTLPDGVFSRSIWVDAGWRRIARLTNRYVRIVGTFHYRPEYRRTIEKRDDGREFESIVTLGYGHFGMSAAEISPITSFRPLR